MRVKDKAYLSKVASLGCINCKSRDAQVHHLRGPKWGYGIALRASDFDTVPLCDTCHDMFHDGKRWTKEEKINVQEKWLAKTRKMIMLIYTNKGE